MTQKPRYVAAKQGVVHVKAKLEMANKAHSNAQRAAESHETNVVTLKQQLKYRIMIFHAIISDLSFLVLTLSVTDLFGPFNLSICNKSLFFRDVEQKKQECEAKLATESQELAMQLSDAQVIKFKFFGYQLFE